MNITNIRTFLTLIGAENVREQTNGWVGASCPFARWRHKGGHDDNPSFGIKVEDDDNQSRFTCFSCGMSGGNVHFLLYKLKEYDPSYQDNRELMAFVKASEPDSDKFKGLVERSTGNRTFQIAKRKEPRISASIMESVQRIAQETQLSAIGVGGNTIVDVEGGISEKYIKTLPESYLKHVKKEPPAYLLNRGFSRDVLKTWEIGTVVNGIHARVAFPVRDMDGNLLAISRRVTWNRATCQHCGAEDVKWGKPCPNCNEDVWSKYEHGKGFNRNFHLYGAYFFERSEPVALLVEGQLDAVRLYEAGFRNVLATFGSKVGMAWPDPTKGKPGEQMHLLTRLCKRVILVCDGDDAGYQWASSIQSLFAGREHLMRVQVFYCPKGEDAGSLPIEYLRQNLAPYEPFYVF
jgi:5S rRNA maturation endonuclease (ribonuclease M5)